MVKDSNGSSVLQDCHRTGIDSKDSIGFFDDPGNQESQHSASSPEKASALINDTHTCVLSTQQTFQSGQSASNSFDG